MFHFNVLVVSWKGKIVTRKALHPRNDCRHWIVPAGSFLTLLERGLFSLLHFGEDTAVCVTKRESSETEAVALVECDEREVVIHNIHIHHTKYTPSAAISSRVSHTQKFSVDGAFAGFLPVLNSLFIILRPYIGLHFSNSVINVLILGWIGVKLRKDEVHSVCWGGCDQSLEWIKVRSSLHSKHSIMNEWMNEWMNDAFI